MGPFTFFSTYSSRDTSRSTKRGKKGMLQIFAQVQGGGKGESRKKI